MQIGSEEWLDRVYDDSNIVRYPEDSTVKDLTHVFESGRVDTSGNPIPFDKAVKLLEESRAEVADWYQKSKGKPMVTLSLGEDLAIVRENFWNHPSFKQAFEVLGIDFDRHHKKINLPWYNEVAVGEASHELRERGANVRLSPMHSLEIQLQRAGVDVPVRGISVDGIILTSPDENSSMGYAVMGVRGGSSFPNNYHLVAAGGLKGTDDLRAERESIYQAFRRTELVPEIGDVTDERIMSARPMSRNVDWIINKGCPTYTFRVQTNLSRDEIKHLWVDAKDGKEHTSLVFIPADPKSTRRFVAEHYRGVVENRQNRSDSERYLLSVAALDLAAYSDMSMKELRELYRPGNW